MADGSSGEKTEMPTPKRLRDAREKGQVCVSRDVVSTALLIVLLWVTWISLRWLMADFRELARYVSQLYGETPEGAVSEAGTMTALLICKHSFMVAGVAALVGVAANLCQVGFLFTLKPLQPDLAKLNPVQGAKRIFSLKNLFEFGKNVLKVCFLGYLIYRLVLVSIPMLLPHCYGTVTDILPVLGDVLRLLATYTAFGYLVIAAADLFFQRRNYTRELMMTKEEVKREYKEMEGSAEVKQAQRQFAQEILSGPNPVKAAKQSTVIVTNPTHLAVGLLYRPGETQLPKVTVKGADAMAAVIRRAAAEAGVPIVENVPLARALYRQAKVDTYIPEPLFEPVVEVLKWVHDMQKARQEEQDLENITLDDSLGDDPTTPPGQGHP